MARQNINRGVTANDGTGDTLRVAAGKINDNFIELYTLLGGDSGQITNILSFADSGLVFNGLTYNTVLGFVEGTSKTTVDLPGSSGIIVVDTATQTLTNKTLTAPVLTGPKINDTSADHKYTIVPSELTANRNITLPLLTANDTFTFNNHTQTLTNKTLTAPTINNPKVVGHINDTSGASVVEINPIASAVNHIMISNAATSGIPQISAHSETDSDVGIGLSAFNNGLIHFQTGLRYRTTTITTGGQNVPLNRPMTIFNAGGPIGATLPDGLYPGHLIIMVNEGAADVTVTPTNFAAATSFSLRNEGITQVIWSGDNWHLMVAKLFDSSDTDALIYVTV